MLQRSMLFEVRYGFDVGCFLNFCQGLAESLHSELLLYGIDVHIYYPATIYSPGYEEENKTKPEITKVIEGIDEGVTPKQGAAILLKGKFGTVAGFLPIYFCMQVLSMEGSTLSMISTHISSVLLRVEEHGIGTGSLTPCWTWLRLWVFH